MNAKIADPAAGVFVDPVAYGDRARMHAALSHLRATAPVSWVADVPDYRPFWAITKHADVMAIERNNTLFRNSPRPFLVSRNSEPYMMSTRSLVDLDEPEHGPLRAIAADWFRPGVTRTLKARVDGLAKAYVDKLLAAGPQCDFVKQVSVDFPLSVVMWLLGLPDAAFPYVLGLTREWFALAGNDSRSGGGGEVKLTAAMEAAQYFAAVIQSRRERPTDDLGSAIANARIDGKLLPLGDMLSYFAIFATAGHDTVNALISGGLLALIEHPDQLERLRDDPGLAAAATEEMIRWVTPTMQFMRTAVADTVVRGEQIAAGESVLLSYVSANHDEDVFDEPCRFVIGRESNRHLSFGYGIHYCLGAALARMEITSIFTEMISRLKTIELAGDPQYHPAIWVGGLKHLPIRYSPR